MKTAYCIKCGNKFPEEAAFCPFCGTKVYRSGDAQCDLKPEDVISDIPSEPISSKRFEESRSDDRNKCEATPEPVVEAVVSSQVDYDDEDELEDPKIFVCILAFLIPIVGFIAAISNRKTNKKKSKTYAMWAWIGFGLNFISRLIQAAM